jgi:hypothetical protein
MSNSPDRHVEEELPALLGGELDLETTRDVTGHLRSCPECRNELVEVAAGISVMRRLDQTSAADQTSGADGPVDAPVPISAARSRSRSRTAMLVAAAVAILFAGAVTTAALLDGRSSGPDATVALAPVSDQSARGSVAMTDLGIAQAMEVDTSLGAAPPDAYYEVWLLDRDTRKMLPVGVLPPDGRGTYRLPGSILEQYDSVDISLQPDDGSTAHSSDSVLRADYA